MPEPILQEGRSPTEGQQREEESMAGQCPLGWLEGVPFCGLGRGMRRVFVYL